MRKLLVTCISVLANGVTLFAQQSKIDSLEFLLRTSQNDSRKIILMNDLAKLYLQPASLDTLKAKVIIGRMKEVAATTGDGKAKALTLLREGMLERQRKHPDAAIQIYNDCIVFSENTNLPREKTEALNSMATLVQQKNKHEDAITLFSEAASGAFNLKD